MYIFNSKHPLRRIKSFKHAFDGVFHALVNEPNFRIQLIISAFAIALGFTFKISNVEWALITLSLGILLSAEMINTVVEEVMDHFFKDEHPVVKVIKDLSAGFVLVSALSTLVIMYLTFGNRILETFLK